MESSSKLTKIYRSPIESLIDHGFSMVMLFLDSESLTRLLITFQKRKENFKDLVRKSAFCKERLKLYSRSLIFVTFETFEPYMKRDCSIEKLSILENSVVKDHCEFRDNELEQYYKSQANHNNMFAKDLDKCKGRKTHQYYHYLNVAINYYYLALEINPECIHVLSELSFILKSIPGKNKETEDVYKKFIQVVQDPKYTVSNISKYNSEVISGTYCSYGNFFYRFPEKKEEAKEAYRKCFLYCHDYLTNSWFNKMTDNLIKRIKTGGSNVHNEVNLVCEICLEFSPNDTEALKLKADVLKQYPNKFNEAIILYRQIIQINPKDTEIMEILAETLLRYPNATEVDRKEAIVLYKTWSKKARGFSKILTMYKFAELMSQRESGYKEAISIDRKFLKGSHPLLYYSSMYKLACILAKTQRGKKEAKRLCQQYLDEEPNDKNALKLLEELK